MNFTYIEEKKRDTPSSTGKSRSPGVSSRTLKTLTTRTGKITHEEQTDIENRVTDSWFSGTIQYYKTSSSPTWFQADNLTVGGAQSDINYKPLPSNGFRGLDWIVESNYAGRVPYGQTDCLIFVPGGYKKLDLRDAKQRESKMATTSQIAYIDADTRLPIAVRIGGELRTFHFDSPPTEMQVFPADLSSQIKKGEEARARLYQPAARPY